MPKTILTVGVHLASDAVGHEPYESNVSLLDWDIILFRPSIPQLWKYAAKSYQGKSCLDDSSSFALKEATEHWRREIKQAIEIGKTVIVFLPPLEEVFVATGEMDYSGTGKNARRTRIVDSYSNYRSLPLSLQVTNSSGSAIKLAPRNTEAIASYWNEFGAISEYKILLPTDTKGACLLTKHGDRAVGAIYRSNTSSGALILLPDIDFNPESFIKEKDGKQHWTGEARKFAARMASAVVAVNQAIHSSIEISPPPTWTADAKFALAKELDLRSQLLESERRVEKAQKHKEDIQGRLQAAGQLRSLLYEKGKPLEHSIIEALRILGFQADPYKEAASEFDVIFESPEGRLLGEAEGKDSKAVNVDKLRQLSMNIHEDLQREEVSSPAKGVLFGNGYRLSPPGKRAIEFTDKCIMAAQSSSTALVTTSDLFATVQYLSANRDDDYAKRCREAIIAGIGLTKLPTPPERAKDVAPETSEQTLETSSSCQASTE
jgi:hypothetical protein